MLVFGPLHELQEEHVIALVKDRRCYGGRGLRLGGTETLKRNVAVLSSTLYNLGERTRHETLLR
jgi:hypothetical protein